MNNHLEVKCAHAAQYYQSNSVPACAGALYHLNELIDTAYRQVQIIEYQHYIGV